MKKQFKKTTLDNGLRIITAPLQDHPTATVLILVEAGSKYETKDNNGISHFLEHMMFKGTKNRQSSMDISMELDSIGAESNAFTSYEYTGYYGKAHFRRLPKVLDVISDLYLNATLPKTEMEKEKGVIIEEINMYEDMPHRIVGDLFMNLLYGDQPAGQTILGKKENIKKMTIEDFIDYRDKHYVASSTVVVVSGRFNEKKVIDLVKKKFKNIRSAPKSKKVKVKEDQKKPQILIKYKKTDQTHFVLGVRSFDALSRHNFSLNVLAGILGKGMSSRLFQKLRDQMGVCYYVRSSNDALTDHGFLEVSAGVDNSRLTEVIKVILAEFSSLKKNLVSEEELTKVKEYMVGHMYLGLESSDSLSHFYGSQEIIGRPPLTPKEISERIKKVKASDIKKLANLIFTNDKLNLALIGPFKDGKKISQHLKIR